MIFFYKHVLFSNLKWHKWDTPTLLPNDVCSKMLINENLYLSNYKWNEQEEQNEDREPYMWRHNLLLMSNILNSNQFSDTWTLQHAPRHGRLSIFGLYHDNKNLLPDYLHGLTVGDQFIFWFASNHRLFFV